MAKSPSLAEVHGAVECLGRLTEIFRQRRQELASSVGLTEQQWSVLDEIEQADFMPSMFARQRESSHELCETRAKRSLHATVTSPSSRRAAPAYL